MNPNYINLIYWNNFLIPKLVIFLLLLLLCKIFFKLLTKDLLPHGYAFFDLKIKNKLHNWVWVLTYISIFILGIAVLRIYRSNLKLELKPIYIFFKFLLLNQEYLIVCIVCMIFILYLLIFTTFLKYAKNFLELCVMKQHIVLRYAKEGYFAWTVPPYDRISVLSPYREIIYWFQKVDYQTLQGKIITYLILPIGLYMQRKSFITLRKIFNKIERFIFLCLDIKYNILMIPLLVIYDCYFHDYVITNLFEFLPYYFIYTLWYKLSRFWYDKTNFQMDDILYELYYCDSTIKYLRLDDEDKIRLDLYVRFGLQIPPGTRDEYYYHDTGMHAFRIQHYSRYELIDEKEQLYHNKRTMDTIRIKEDKKG